MNNNVLDRCSVDHNEINASWNKGILSIKTLDTVVESPYKLHQDIYTTPYGGWIFQVSESLDVYTHHMQLILRLQYHLKSPIIGIYTVLVESGEKITEYIVVVHNCGIIRYTTLRDCATGATANMNQTGSELRDQIDIDPVVWVSMQTDVEITAACNNWESGEIFICSKAGQLYKIKLNSIEPLDICGKSVVQICLLKTDNNYSFVVRKSSGKVKGIGTSCHCEGKQIHFIKSSPCKKRLLIFYSQIMSVLKYTNDAWTISETYSLGNKSLADQLLENILHGSSTERSLCWIISSKYKMYFCTRYSEIQDKTDNSEIMNSKDVTTNNNSINGNIKNITKTKKYTAVSFIITPRGKYPVKKYYGEVYNCIEDHDHLRLFTSTGIYSLKATHKIQTDSELAVTALHLLNTNAQKIILSRLWPTIGILARNRLWYTSVFSKLGIVTPVCKAWAMPLEVIVLDRAFPRLKWKRMSGLLRFILGIKLCRSDSGTEIKYLDTNSFDDPGELEQNCPMGSREQVTTELQYISDIEHTKKKDFISIKYRCLVQAVKILLDSMKGTLSNTEVASTLLMNGGIPLDIFASAPINVIHELLEICILANRISIAKVLLTTIPNIHKQLSLCCDTLHDRSTALALLRFTAPTPQRLGIFTNSVNNFFYIHDKTDSKNCVKKALEELKDQVSQNTQVEESSILDESILDKEAPEETSSYDTRDLRSRIHAEVHGDALISSLLEPKAEYLNPTFADVLRNDDYSKILGYSIIASISHKVQTRSLMSSVLFALEISKEASAIQKYVLSLLAAHYLTYAIHNNDPECHDITYQVALSEVLGKHVNYKDCLSSAKLAILVYAASGITHLENSISVFQFLGKLVSDEVRACEVIRNIEAKNTIGMARNLINKVWSKNIQPEAIKISGYSVADACKILITSKSDKIARSLCKSVKIKIATAQSWALRGYEACGNIDALKQMQPEKHTIASYCLALHRAGLTVSSDLLLQMPPTIRDCISAIIGTEVQTNIGGVLAILRGKLLSGSHKLCTLLELREHLKKSLNVKNWELEKSMKELNATRSRISDEEWLLCSAFLLSRASEHEKALQTLFNYRHDFRVAIIYLKFRAKSIRLHYWNIFFNFILAILGIGLALTGINNFIYRKKSDCFL